jgi:hypothetical protein
MKLEEFDIFIPVQLLVKATASKTKFLQNGCGQKLKEKFRFK